MLKKNDVKTNEIRFQEFTEGVEVNSISRVACSNFDTMPNFGILELLTKNRVCRRCSDFTRKKNHHSKAETILKNCQPLTIFET